MLKGWSVVQGIKCCAQGMGCSAEDKMWCSRDGVLLMLIAQCPILNTSICYCAVTAFKLARIKK